MTVHVEGLEDLNKALAKYADRFEAEAKRAVNATAQGIRNTAVRSIMKQSPQGRTYELYSPRRTHMASAPGYPPNMNTGRLSGSITVHDSGKYTAEVIAGAEYSAYLEFGTRKMAARPFMQPAVAMEREKFVARIRAISDKAHSQSVRAGTSRVRSIINRVRNWFR